MNRIKFLRKGLQNLKTVGTITRSSRFLCRAMVRQVDFSDVKVVVELGAGDGVVTRHILKAMAPDARLLAFEIHEDFCEMLRVIDDPRLEVLCASAEDLSELLADRSIAEIDCVFSEIPFVVFPEEKALQIIGQCRDALRMGGKFIQIHYSLLAKKLYEKVFGNVKVRFMPLNLPPAFVLSSRKNTFSQKTEPGSHPEIPPSSFAQ